MSVYGTAMLVLSILAVVINIAMLAVNISYLYIKSVREVGEEWVPIFVSLLFVSVPLLVVVCFVVL